MQKSDWRLVLVSAESWIGELDSSRAVVKPTALQYHRQTTKELHFQKKPFALPKQHMLSCGLAQISSRLQHLTAECDVKNPGCAERAAANLRRFGRSRSKVAKRSSSQDTAQCVWAARFSGPCLEPALQQGDRGTEWAAATLRSRSL